ncbi:response regulator [Pseudoalteromonas sp. MMG010]|uniref:response regulator n=1 Tax=Pseudoalteromonas sp. MMG010 TaxID=2822685 RepID=UPI001B3A0F0C|nr:response regulator [Pseudoalteromonas sp. MMG010]MBQ4833976.1 response regulator [Pseudoalteromonas sp. MMG010]
MNNVRSVLVIDDDEDDTFLIESRLESFFGQQCQFVSCYEKHDAVNYLKERTFDLCILDYHLAGYKGIEILHSVANAELATPIVMLTGQDDNEVAKQVIKAGAQDFIMKSSIDEVVFEKSIQYAIARKELEFAKVVSQQNEAQSIAKDKFIAHLSHELRTPLTSILGYTSLLLDNENTKPFQQELKVIANNGSHLLNLLNDVLDLSKIAANKFELRAKPTDFQQLLAEVNSLISVSAIDKGLSLTFVGKTKLPEQIEIDDIRFKQVLLNLLGNAIKFTDKGFITVSVEYFAQQKQLKVRVRDTGIGMSKSQLNDIFGAFTQIEDVANRRAGGAGLGLSISTEIVKQMGGTITVDSTIGEGSCFTLSLPCHTSSDQLVDYYFNLDAKEHSSLTTPQLTGKVLVVDDVFEIRQLVGLFLSETGLQVEYAGNGEQALQKVTDIAGTHQQYDMVIMDLHMPAMTGQEAIVKMRVVEPSLCVIAMTAAMGKGLHDTLIQEGFNDLIAKPINKESLWHVLTANLHAKNINKNDNTAATTPAKKTLIHLVEDDEDSATIMQMILNQLGCDVLHSKNALTAIDTAKSNHNIDFHLLDLGLPDLNSDDFLDAFFQQSITGKVTILSGSHVSQACLTRYNIKQHLLKPINKDTLTQWLTQQRL